MELAEESCMTEVLAVRRELPPGWVIAALAEVANINPKLDRRIDDDATTVTFIPMAAVDVEHGGLRRPELRPYGEVKKGYTAFQSGDVIFAKITPCMENGKIAVVPPVNGDVCFGSTEFHVFRPRSDILAHWLSYYLAQEGFRRLARMNMTGTAGQIRVPRRFLDEVMLPIAPADEQQRIVDKIDELLTDLDAGVAALERVREKLKAYRASVLKAAVEGRLTEQWRADHPDVEPADKLLERILAERRERWIADQLDKWRAKQADKGWDKAKIAKAEPAERKKIEAKYKPPAEPDTTDLPDLPKGWCWASIDQLLAMGNYGTSVKCDYEADGVPVLRIPNIQRGDIDLRDLKYATQDLGELGDNLLAKGDMLVCRTNGSIDLIGKTAVIHMDFNEPHHFASYLIRLRLVDPGWAEYVHIVFESAFGRHYIESHAASSAGQHNISLTLLRQFPVPLPSIQEQPEVVSLIDEHLSTLSVTEKAADKQIARAARLRQSILKRAFEGKLVPQDPNDEPAEKLLDRIRQHREAEAAKGKKAKKVRKKVKKVKA